MVGRNLRLIRAFRFIYDIPLLKKQMDAFIGSLPKLRQILIPVLFVILYYSIIGLHLFSGVTENRCREGE
jgi:hypothetical protein